MKSGVFDFTKSTTGANNMADMKTSRRSHVIVGMAASVLTLLLAVAVVTSVFFGTQLCNSRSNMLSGKKQKFAVRISDSPSMARVAVSKERRLIWTETPYSGELDHTITLQDYNRELQAIKDLNRNACFVLPVFSSFEDALVVTEGNTTSQNDSTFHMEMSSTTTPIPQEVLPWAVGEHISGLCAGMPTYWLYEEGMASRQKRAIIIVKYKGVLIVIRF